MGKTQPDLGILRVLVQQRLIELAGSLVFANPATDHGRQVPVSGSSRILFQQLLYFNQRLIGLIGAMKQHSEVIPRT